MSRQGIIIAKGVALYEANKPRAAFNAFKEACLLCDCNDDKAALLQLKSSGQSLKEFLLPICHCKDFISILREFDPAERHSDAIYKENRHAIYILATKKCDCGSDIKVCHSASHIQALSHISSLYEEKKDHKRALQYASLLLLVAPHAPEGYMRLANATSLREADKPKAKRQRLWVYSQACSSVRLYGDKDSPLLKAIEGRVKVDPMRKLPKELQGMVLGYLPVTKLGAIMSVSRLWNEACREPRLWKDLRFIRHWSSGEPRPFPRGALSTIIKYAENSVTSLHITGLKDFSLSGPMLRQMLRALPQLQSLALGITNPRYPSPRLTFDYELLTWHDVWNILLDVAPSTLTALSLSTFALTDAAQQALQPVSGIPEFAQNLEQLTLVGVADRDIHPWTAFAWPKLTKLSLTGPEGWSRVRVNTGLGFKMRTLRDATPALRDLHLAHLTIIDLDSINRQGHDLQGWSSQVAFDTLERLSLRNTQVDGIILGLCSSTLRCLESDHTLAYGLELETLGLFVLPESELQIFPLDDTCKNLEHVTFFFNPDEWMEGDHRYNGDLPDRTEGDGPTLFARVAPSFQQDTVKSFNITFELQVMQHLWMAWPKESSHSLHTLGLHEIREDSITEEYEDGTVETWDETEYIQDVVLPRFPNLHTVGLFAHLRETCARLVAQTIKNFPNIRTIYAFHLGGVERDEVLAYARSEGVTVYEAKELPKCETD